MATLHIYDSIQQLARSNPVLILDDILDIQETVGNCIAIKTKDAEYNLPANTIMKITGNDEE